MKHIFLAAIIFSTSTFLFGQMPNDWGAFNQRLDAKTFAGRKFKLQAAVKVQLIDTTSEAEIWVRVDKPNKKIGFFYNMMDKPIRGKDWKIYSIEGRVDKDAEYFAFGGLYSRKGIFYFDDFKLSIETTQGNFEEVNIKNGNFENDSLNIPWGFLRQQGGFNLSTTRETSFEGKQSCKVDGSQFRKQFTFGNNDSTGKYAIANGIKIYYEEYGQGQPLLLLHGNSESIGSFKLQIPEFSKYYKVIAVDTRGQGKSSEDGRTYTYDLFADDMNALLNNLNIDSANVLGWSDGGNTGLIMAMKYPKKVKRLVTMGANVFIDKSVVAKWVFKELNKQLTEMKMDTSYADRNRIRLINLLLTEPKHNFEELKIINCPVLVLAGEKDVIKENHTKGIAANIRNSTLIIAPKETHYYPLENSKEFNKTLLEYLRTK